jgi:hypothetical protein
MASINEREGALKISDHHVRSPLLNINRACQTCHKVSEQELKARVETIQERTFRLRNLAMDALVELISDVKQAKTAGKDVSSWSPRATFSARRSFFWISSRRKFQPASMPRRRRREFSANRSTLRAGNKSRFAQRSECAPANLSIYTLGVNQSKVGFKDLFRRFPFIKDSGKTVQVRSFR